MKCCNLLCVFALSQLLAGCGSVLKSEYTPPAITYPSQWQGSLGKAIAVPFSWKDFGDPQLENWLRQVLAKNNDLAVAALRLYRADLDAERAGIDAAPTVNTNMNIARNKNLYNSSPWGESSQSTLSVTYEADLWGKLARQQDAAEWSRRATAEDLAAARLALIANASRNYWQIAYLNQRISVSEESIGHARSTLRLVNARYRAGSVSLLDVVEAEQNVTTQETSHLTLLQQRKQALNLQTVLLGVPPGNTVIEPKRLPDGPLPSVKSDIPAIALARRPDIAASEMRLHEALANVDAKRAQYYPTLNLTGSAGGSSTALFEFLRNPVATLGAGLTLPFLQFRQMGVEVKISRVEYQQRVIAFKQSLYKAMAGVEDALSVRTQLIAQEQQLLQMLSQAKRAENLNEIRYREGAVPVNFWLDAQEKRRQAQIALDSNRNEQLQNLAKLYEELGGNGETAM